MPLDDQKSRPLYQQVADQLRGQIQRQELPPGHQLPTEAKLMDEYGVSRNTVRLALGLLRNEGLVVTGQGRGSFVADVPSPVARRQSGGPRPIVNRHSTDQPVIEFGEPGGAEHIDITVTSRLAPPVVSDALRLPSGGRVLERRRLLYRDRQPSEIADSYLPEELVVDDAARRTSPLSEGIAGALEAAGRPITGHVDEITVRMPSPAEAQELQIATGVPVMSILRTAYDSTDEPICATILLLPGDRHMLRYNVSVDRPEVED